MKKITITLLLLFLMLLAACGGNTEETATAVPAESTEAPTAEPVAEPTAVPEPTDEPSETVDEDDLDVPPPVEEIITLRANPWQWDSFTNPVEQFAVENPGNYVVTFNDDGSVDIKADCNNAGGDAVVDSSSLTINIGPMTAAACEAESRSDAFVQYLGNAAIYFFEDGKLHLDLMADSGTMVFSFAGEDEAIDDGAVSADLPRFEPVDDCFVELPDDYELELDLQCGYIVVPEFYHGESSRELKLGIIRIKSNDGAENSPLFMLAGGPGSSYFQLETFSLFTPEVLGGVLDARDIVLIEQRGNKYTDTYLDCPEFFSASWTAYEQGLDEEGGIALEKEVLQSCIDDFEAQGINFDAYNSGENAADVNAVRQALGYDQIVYYGSSYGSQLGQHVMRDFPDILEAVVLDGANSLSRKSWVEERALDAQWGIDNLIELCAADEKCAEAYDIPIILDAALALFDDGPINYTYVDPNDSTVTVDVEVTKSDLANTIHKTQGNPYTVFGLPLLLEQLTQGGVDTMRELLGEEKATNLLAARDPVDGGLTVLMHYAMVCSDDHVNSIDDVITEGVGEYARLFGQNQAPGYVQACSIIDVAEMPDSTDIDVTLDVPTLLLAGGLDIATPAFRSQIVADALPNATLLIFPGQSHVQISSATHICAGQIATQFILDPTTSLDTSCLEGFQVPGFILPDGSMSHE